MSDEKLEWRIREIALEFFKDKFEVMYNKQKELEQKLELHVRLDQSLEREQGESCFREFKEIRERIESLRKTMKKIIKSFLPDLVHQRLFGMLEGSGETQNLSQSTSFKRKSGNLRTDSKPDSLFLYGCLNCNNEFCYDAMLRNDDGDYLCPFCESNQTYSKPIKKPDSVQITDIRKGQPNIYEDDFEPDSELIREFLRDLDNLLGLKDSYIYKKWKKRLSE